MGQVAPTAVTEAEELLRLLVLRIPRCSKGARTRGTMIWPNDFFSFNDPNELADFSIGPFPLPAPPTPPPPVPTPPTPRTPAIPPLRIFILLGCIDGDKGQGWEEDHVSSKGSLLFFQNSFCWNRFLRLPAEVKDGEGRGEIEVAMRKLSILGDDPLGTVGVGIGGGAAHRTEVELEGDRTMDM